MVSDVERGKFAGPKTYDALERKLHFPDGSFQAYLDGGPKPVATPPKSVIAPPANDDPPREYSPEMRQRMITMNRDEALEFIKHEWISRGEEAALRAMAEIVRVREEARAVPLDLESH